MNYSTWIQSAVTITLSCRWAWIHLMERSLGAGNDWSRFCHQEPDLLTWSAFRLGSKRVELDWVTYDGLKTELESGALAHVSVFKHGRKPGEKKGKSSPRAVFTHDLPYQHLTTIIHHFHHHRKWCPGSCIWYAHLILHDNKNKLKKSNSNRAIKSKCCWI